MHENSKGVWTGTQYKETTTEILERTECGTKGKKVLGNTFNTERGVTQGGPISLTIFNIVVNAVVRAFLLEF